MIEFFLGLGVTAQIAYILLILTLLYQLFMWLGFSAIATHRNAPTEKKSEELPSISIVIVVGDGGSWYVESEIEKILEQKYDGEWEVVVVNDCGGVEVGSALSDMELRYPRLRSTELRKDPKFPHSRKIPIFLGVKSAKFPHILIADPTASPRSKRWLHLMSKGFDGASVVVGYSGFEPSTSKFIRSSRLMSSIRSLSSAVADRTYRGIFNNIGYTRDSFFRVKGFTHLRLATGEDDLFVQKLAKSYDVNVVLHPRATMEQTAFGGLRWWWAEQRYRTFSMRYYPASVRFKIFMELLIKVLFFGAVTFVALDSLLWGGVEWGWMVAAGAFVLRELVVVWSVRRIMRRLGEKKLLFAFIIYDIINPLTELLLGISRKIKTPKEVWK